MNFNQALAALLLLGIGHGCVAQTHGRETPDEMRRIVAQAICLAEAYPGSAVAEDSAGVIAVYQGSLGKTVSADDIDAVRQLARDAKPAALTPVGNRNLALARCVLFADRSDVKKLLTSGSD